MISRIVSTWRAFAATTACVIFLITMATETAQAEGGEGYDAILHIPHLVVLDLFPEASNHDGTEGAAASAAVDWFEERLCKKPKAVVLPLITPDGVGFKSKLGVDRQLSLRADKRSTNDVASAAVEFAKRGMSIYVSVIPSLPFVNAATIQVTDIVDDESAHACINRDGTQRLLKMLVNDGIGQIKSALTEAGQSAEIAGIVLDITNLWPMSARGVQMELTCYCEDCVRTLDALEKKYGYGFDLKTFRSFPNPWNLLLFDNPDTGGISYSDEFTLRNKDQTLIPEVLRLAAGKKFYPDFWKEEKYDEGRRRKLAEQLVSYLRVRERLTLNAVTRFFENFQLENPNAKRIVLTDEAMYNWTSGVGLGSLDDTSVCDEIWFPPTSRDQKLSNVKARAYMWNRASYFPNSFFNFAGLVLNATRRESTNVSGLPSAELIGMLEQRARGVRVGELGSAVDMFLLPKEYENTYVVVGMDEKIVDGMLENLRRRFETELSGR